MPSYKFSYSDTNSYGCAMRLVRELARGPGLHLDLGAGHGAIAESVREHGLEYVGFDFDQESVRDLESRGIEAHRIDLEDVDAAIDVIRSALRGRKIASVTMLDVLEHITTGPRLLAALRQLLDGLAIPFVICVPNVGHRDLAMKLLAGRWDYTETGLLDHTHVIHHTSRLLGAMMRSSGFREVAAADVVLANSDQHFPSDFPLFDTATTIGALLDRVKRSADPTSATQQLVRAYLPAQTVDVPLLVERAEPAAPFLTVVSRTQGRRIDLMREMLLCLTAQTCQDFEHLIVAHKVTVEQQIAVEALIEELPAPQRSRTTLIVLDRGGRAAPLNLGMERARGTYVAMLDDDDLVFSHWVETFQKLATSGNVGRVLRTVCVDQSIEATTEPSLGSFRIIGPPTTTYPSEYDLLAHLERNFTPLMCLAFPRALYRDLGMRFDEELSTCEDWDFEMRSALLVGVAASPEITAIYRRWKTGESSESVHGREIWEADHRRIVDRLSAMPHVVPPGTIARYLDVIRWTRGVEASKNALEERVAALEAELAERRGHGLDDKIFRLKKTGARWRRRALSAIRAAREPK